MRVAICFSGQPRFVDEAKDSIIQNIFERNSHHSIDVFVHTWFSEEMCEGPLYNMNEYSSFSGGATIKSNSVEQIVKYYSPVSIVVEEPMEFSASDKIMWQYQRWNIDNQTFPISKDQWVRMKMTNEYSKYLSLSKSIDLKKKHEDSFGEYDLVLRMRTDCKTLGIFDFDSLDPSLMHSQEMNKPFYEVSDWINISSTSNMDMIGGIYGNIDYLTDFSYNSYGGWSAESLIRSVCDINGIGLKNSDFKCVLPGWGKYSH